MSDGLMPGWYTDEQGTRRYWTGQAWLAPEASTSTPEPTTVPTSTSTAESDTPATSAVAKRSSKRWFVWSATGFFVLVAIAAGVVIANIPTYTERAVGECQDAVRSILKSPSSAQFVGEPDTTHIADRWDYAIGLLLMMIDDKINSSPMYSDLSGYAALSRMTNLSEKISDESRAMLNAWRDGEGADMVFVTGEVDAQNSFGTFGRKEYSCMYFDEKAEVITFGDNVMGADLLLDSLPNLQYAN